LRCGNSIGQWRNYWAKQIEAGDTSKLRIKADLELTDYEGFFTECGGQGVKSDDYVDLIVLSSDPRQNLGLECNRSVSENDWPKCGVPNSGAGVLAHCGVAKCSASRQCDFEVDTASHDFVYLVFRVGDAWAADIEGRLSNLYVCSSP